MINLQTPLSLPCSAVLKNRLAKAAMTERIADSSNLSTSRHNKLYRTWAKTGVGLLISGNIMVDKIHLESAGNICLTSEKHLSRIKEMTAAGVSEGAHFWAQISHAGRQTSIFNCRKPLAPSAVKLKKLGFFGTPVEMSEEEIEDTIAAYVRTALLAKQGGFTGVQIHAAHGYLVSQFLSPITNRRNDQWGGSLENRSRFLRRIIERTRIELGSDFPISVKLNSADFQRGGFSEAESLEVILMLEEEGIDLLEISGGTYEKVAFFEGDTLPKKSTLAREAYFLDFATKVKAVCSIPIMVTGGFKTRIICEEALQKGELDMIGMARPFITNLNEISAFIYGAADALIRIEPKTRLKIISDSVVAGYYAKELIRISEGKEVRVFSHPMRFFFFLISYELYKALKKEKSH